MNNTPVPNIYATPPGEPSPKHTYRYTTTDFVLAIVLWVVGYLFCVVSPVMDHPILAFLFEVFIFIGAAVFLTRRTVGGKLSTRAVITVVVSLILALSLLFTTNRAVVNCVFIWNCFAWFYLVFVMTGNSRETVPGGYFVGEFLSAAVVMPFRAPGHLFGALFGRKKNPDGSARPRGKVSAAVGWVCVGLGIAVIPTLVVVLLLSYDKGFTDILDTILDTLFSAEELFRQIRNVGLGILVGALLFGAVLAGTHKKSRSRESEESRQPTPRDGAHLVPVPLMAAALTPILVIYVIFFISQWDYYVSAFTGVRPEELTYSTYAREGFFQLLAVTVINAAAGLAASLLTVRRSAAPDRPRRDRTSPVMRVYMAVLSVFTLVLIATALAKMFLYVDTYGMTHKRTYATWLMLLLAVFFVAVLLRQIWARMNLTGTLLAVSLVFLVAVSVVNVDSLIMQYNVNAALDGNLRTMQGDVCEDCGYSGVFAALDYMEASADTSALTESDEFSEDEFAAVRENTDRYLRRMGKELDGMKWYQHNLVTLRAKAALDEAGYGTTSQ